MVSCQRTHDKVITELNFGIKNDEITKDLRSAILGDSVRLKNSIAEIMSGNSSNNTKFSNEEIEYLKSIVFSEHYESGDYTKYKIYDHNKREVVKSYFHSNGTVSLIRHEILSENDFWGPIWWLAMYYEANGVFPLKNTTISVKSEGECGP